ncbi:hypothetical protein [Romboutsia sp. 1001216sp1]|uniref:hypothetical protein n=1 Tax=Romboutsia sp. 1001216sp1 TaxID=2986997 RepID=UPI00232BAF7C|nr:hypothetical protein [Romboutsia sp. 1001216sp1]MDB8805004.1 hypothetical protein [Romboutsia sp. 1001216sp1]MDB8807994.1 hypothetical protein [Romboutsia sp. 1001216sp1]MDB8810649.1 hypothetical protein [Romboutsia sp. 1001216sp1]MDB8816369.1 hypothetical protein [Romboutsia sp. 1001216sp1]MDB8818678.1 hypothetical protein [Romboutsia sp. 1001216sp1]
MKLYTNKELVDVFDLSSKGLLDCGISRNIIQVTVKGVVHTFLEVVDKEIFDSSKKCELEELTLEQANAKITELKEIEKREQEEAYKQTDAYKISILEQGLANAEYSLMMGGLL